MSRSVAICALLLAGCGGGDEGGLGDAGRAGDAQSADATPPPDADTLHPTRLRDTGLWSDFAGEVLADGVRAYRPEQVLWSDGATKRRWIYLPPGTTIDTSDMDYWVMPVGTKLWKEFTRDGTRVETRMLSKIAGGTWYRMAYAWNADQTEAVAVPDGVTDALGTPHDIPSTNDCEKCHDRMPDVLLGFAAIQLDHPGPGVTLDSLVTDGLLSDPPTGSAPYFDIPGDATQAAALRYLHGNCGGCHHPQSDVKDEVPLELRLEVDTLVDVTQTPAYITAVDVDSSLTLLAPDVTKIIASGDRAHSALYLRMTRRDMKQMPPLGTEEVDPTGSEAVGAWIDSL